MDTAGYSSEPPQGRAWLLTGVTLVALLLLFAFAFQGSRGIFGPDEGFYVEIARSMLSSGDFVVPRLQGDPWLDKPPLSMWGIAAGMRLLGQNEWGARAFVALCFVLTVLLIFFFGNTLWSRKEGLLSAAIYATMVIPFSAANIITPDTPLTLWTTASLFCFWKGFSAQANRRGPWKLVMCGVVGLAFLTKGPAALVPTGAMFVFLLLQRRTLRFFATPWILVGFGLFGAVGLGWYFVVARELPGATAYFLDNQVIGRTIADTYARNPGLLGAMIYIPVILLGTLPWSLVWWWRLWGGRRRISLRGGWQRISRNPANVLLATWTTVPLIVYCMASSRLPLYALPVFPALALVTGRIWPHTAPRITPRHNRRLPLAPKPVVAFASFALVLLSVKLAAVQYPSHQDMRALESSLRPYLPDATYELVAVDEALDGLSFYGISLVERVTALETPYPFFSQTEHISDEVAELKGAERPHLFLCRSPWQSALVVRLLEKDSICYRRIPIPSGGELILCPCVPQNCPGKENCGRGTSLG